MDGKLTMPSMPDLLTGPADEPDGVQLELPDNASVPPPLLPGVDLSKGIAAAVEGAGGTCGVLQQQGGRACQGRDAHTHTHTVGQQLQDNVLPPRCVLCVMPSRSVPAHQTATLTATMSTACCPHGGSTAPVRPTLCHDHHNTGWSDVRLLAPRAELRLQVAGGSSVVDTARLSYLGEALRALLVLEARRARLVSSKPPAQMPTHLAPGCSALECEVTTGSGAAVRIVLGGRPGVLAQQQLVEHALRQTLVCFALFFEAAPAAHHLCHHVTPRTMMCWTPRAASRPLPLNLWQMPLLFHLR